MVMRSLLRGPTSVFELYKTQTHSNPKKHNMFLLLGSMFGVLVIGQGAEKIVCKHPLQGRIDAKRLAARSYVPYFIAGYQWNYPKNI
jgi:hypothetical protein